MNYRLFLYIHMYRLYSIVLAIYIPYDLFKQIRTVYSHLSGSQFEIYYIISVLYPDSLRKWLLKYSVAYILL